MLLYDNRARWRLILQFYGSIYRRVYVAVIIFGLYSIALLMLKRYIGNEHMPAMDHPFAAQSLGVLIAFSVCFRTNIAWNRFWESCREVMFMYSKWCDAYSQLMGFITCTEKMKENADTRRLEHTRMEITHFFSLLSAVASERLMRGDIKRMEMRRRKGVPWNQQVVFRENLRTTDLTGSKNLFPMRVLLLNPHQYDEADEESDDAHRVSDKMDRVLSQPPHQKSGKSVRWMSVVTRPQHLDRQGGARVSAFVSEGNGNSSLTPFRATGTTTGDTWEEPVSIVGEVSSEEFRRLRNSTDRVNLLLLWINELVANLTPHLIVAPPIVSRVFQEISNGALGYSQAEKLSDIPFPFIFAQLLAVAVIFIAIVSPIAFTLITGDSWLTPLVSTGVVTSFWALNEMAKELENPFGNEANNVPLLDAHERFIEFLTEMHGICLPKDRDYKPPNPSAAVGPFERSNSLQAGCPPALPIATSSCIASTTSGRPWGNNNSPPSTATCNRGATSTTRSSNCDVIEYDLEAQPEMEAVSIPEEAAGRGRAMMHRIVPSS
mmetsp:Transcript_36896/g.68944  ORF Transcript_36896/g.68944 Transcript_36896/m.68944 type:complete len:548 (-) Transcript_36896:49-1692(-)